MTPYQQNGMDPEDQRNFIVAMILMVTILFIYQGFFAQPARNPDNTPATPMEAGDESVPDTDRAITPITVEAAIAENDRIRIEGARVNGSLRLEGTVIDDLSLKDHYRTIEQKQTVRLLRPSASPHGYYTSWYWTSGSEAVAGPSDTWSPENGSTLQTGRPVVMKLVKDNLEIVRRISIDENYMFTYQDTLTNTGASPVTLSAVGLIRRRGPWKGFLEETERGSSSKVGLVHQGLIGVFNSTLKERDYKNLGKGKGLKGKPEERTGISGGWLGLTDMYWMTALVPDQSRKFAVAFNLRGADRTIMDITVKQEPISLQPGTSIQTSNRIFVGAKEYDVVKDYQHSGIPRFDDSIDWGILYYITQPFFSLLNWLQIQLGSFGLAIVALTLIIKIPLIPLYNQSYKSMAKMKKLTEPMKEIQARFKDDPGRRQQEIMKLYKREKANPLAGCLPILLTIPIFFALYKILYVTIEMRHTPFLWLPDLSAPDTLIIGNLFGLLPWATAQEIHAMQPWNYLLGVGILAILYALSMAAIQALSPPPPDPTQRTVMMVLPFVFMFVFGSFAAGLVLYWVWSNLLSLVQQYYIMRRNGVETEFDKLIGKLWHRFTAPSG